MTRLFSARKKVLGIIGGMGPMASAYFGRLLVEMADVDTDQQHLPTILLNIPEIPDRTAYILGRSEKSPVPVLTAAAKTLGENCSVHDVRLVSGDTHSNLIFDVLVPHSLSLSDDEIRKKIREEMPRLKEDPTLYTVISVDRDYTGRS